ncbi:MAG: leucine-rich repeat protein [Mycoplasma sp.]
MSKYYRNKRSFSDFFYNNKVKIISIGSALAVTGVAVGVAVPFIISNNQGNDQVKKDESFGSGTIIEVKEDYEQSSINDLTDKLFDSETSLIDKDELSKYIDISEYFPSDAKLTYASTALTSETTARISFIADKYNAESKNQLEQEPKEFFFEIDVIESKETTITGNAAATYSKTLLKNSLEKLLLPSSFSNSIINWKYSDDVKQLFFMSNMSEDSQMKLISIDDETQKNYFNVTVTVTNCKDANGNLITGETKFDNIQIYHKDVFNTEFDSKNGYMINGLSADYSTDSIKELRFPAKINGVEIYGINERAFAGNHLLHSISFAEDSKIKWIGFEAFANCTNTIQNTLSIPSSVVRIEEGAFSNMKNVSAIEVEDTKYNNSGIKWWKGYSTDEWEKIIYRDGTMESGYINDSSFDIIGNKKSGLTITKFNNSSDKDVYGLEIPNEIGGIKVVKIGKNAFKNEQNNPKIYNSLKIGDNVEVIESSAFRGQLIDSITLNEKLITIGDRAFSDLGNIDTPLLIPSSVKTISEYAFMTSSIRGLEFAPSSKLETIGDYAFGLNWIKGKLSIPSEVLSIGNNAFYRNRFITGINFEGSKLKMIGVGAFRECFDLGYDIDDRIITIPTSVTSIGEKAFAESGYTEVEENLLTIKVSQELFNSKEIWGIEFEGTIAKI